MGPLGQGLRCILHLLCVPIASAFSLDCIGNLPTFQTQTRSSPPNPSPDVTPMSAPPTSISGSDFGADDADSNSERVWCNLHSNELEYAVTHVFLPFMLTAPPDENDHFLVCVVCAVARAFSEVIDDTLKPQWRCITKMLENLEASIRPGRLDTEGHVMSLLCEMQTEGTLLISLQTLC